jgi:methyltransferase, FkbM family
MFEKINNKHKIRVFFVKLFDILCCMLKWRKCHKILMKYGSNSENFFFIEIGANDGIIYDPIYQHAKKYNWSGILVEPVAYYFNKLKANYKENSNLIFENVAISDKEEARDFYRIKEGLNYLPNWCEGLGSFYLDVVLTHKWAIPNIEDYIVKDQVKCVSFESLLKKYNVKIIDLLSMDTEGYDYEIIKQIDFKKIKPRIIIYEHRYINKRDRKNCERALRENNYSLTKHLGNTLAYLPS